MRPHNFLQDFKFLCNLNYYLNAKYFRLCLNLKYVCLHDPISYINMMQGLYGRNIKVTYIMIAS